MDSSTEENVISEELWRAWFERDRHREKATARRLKIVAGKIIGLVALGSVVYFVFFK